MSDQSQNQDTSGSSEIEGAQKDPEQWTTGGESITGPQLSYLTTLAQQAGEEDISEERFSSMTKAEASEEINRLQELAGVSGDDGPSDS